MWGETDLEEIVRSFRAHSGVRSKSSIQLITDVLGPTDWFSGPGDDAASIVDGDGILLVAGEALYPPFLQADPFGSGIASVVANVNDIAAMGGRALALVDTFVGPEATARRALEGMRFAAELYGVPIVGGHLTVWDGPPALSVFISGRAAVPLSVRNVMPGQAVLLACCVDGTMREDFPFFSSVRERGSRIAGDIALLARIGEEGLCVAAKDVSMAGLLGSLAMLLEGTGAGITVALDQIPRPAGVSLIRWTTAFPSFAFLLACPANGIQDCCGLFHSRGLECDQIGVLDASGQVRIRLANQEELLIDLNCEGVTGLQRA